MRAITIRLCFNDATPGPVAVLEAQPLAPMMASAPVAGRVSDFLRELIIKVAMRRTGATYEDVDRALAVAEGDRPILDWLKDGGLETIIKVIVSILAMFVLAPEPTAFGSLKGVLIRDLLIRAAANQLGLDRSVVEKAISFIETEKSTLEWLKDGGLDAVFAVISAAVEAM